MLVSQRCVSTQGDKPPRDINVTPLKLGTSFVAAVAFFAAGAASMAVRGSDSKLEPKGFG
jgi:hypothetical protein